MRLVTPVVLSAETPVHVWKHGLLFEVYYAKDTAAYLESPQPMLRVKKKGVYQLLAHFWLKSMMILDDSSEIREQYISTVTADKFLEKPDKQNLLPFTFSLSTCFSSLACIPCFHYFSARLIYPTIFSCFRKSSLAYALFRNGKTLGPL
jgi:hypothetical protein